MRIPIVGIDVVTAKARLETGRAIMIDIREADEWEAERVPGIPLRPLSTLTTDQVADDGRELLILCRSGHRAGRLAVALAQRGLHRAPLVVEGGILAWAAAGLPVETGRDTPDGGPPPPES